MMSEKAVVEVPLKKFNDIYTQNKKQITPKTPDKAAQDESEIIVIDDAGNLYSNQIEINSNNPKVKYTNIFIGNISIVNNKISVENIKVINGKTTKAFIIKNNINKKALKTRDYKENNIFNPYDTKELQKMIDSERNTWLMKKSLSKYKVGSSIEDCFKRSGQFGSDGETLQKGDTITSTEKQAFNTFATIASDNGETSRIRPASSRFKSTHSTFDEMKLLRDKIKFSKIKERKDVSKIMTHREEFLPKVVRKQDQSCTKISAFFSKSDFYY